jgi:hypothetical protein
MSQTLIGTHFGYTISTAEMINSGRGFTLGSIAAGPDGKTYRYVQSASAIAAYDVVHVPSDTNIAAGLTTALSAASEVIGVAPVAIASGAYGWVQTYGATKVSVAGSCAKAVTLYSTTTAGRLDDATASNYQITGIQILSTNPSATATTMSAFVAFPKVRILPGVL